jgi:hypothetical protein
MSVKQETTKKAKPLTWNKGKQEKKKKKKPNQTFDSTEEYDLRDDKIPLYIDK